VSRNWEPINKEVIRAAADLTYRQHQPQGDFGTPGWCRQCMSTGCPQLDWATEVRAGGKAAYPVAPEEPMPVEVT
jgi:hypothetical protein